ncbi:MAG: thiol:disulfide interchange protein DsbA/DsbL [Candidatus Eutrophobiaceae bacterium]
MLALLLPYAAGCDSSESTDVPQDSVADTAEKLSASEISSSTTEASGDPIEIIEFFLYGCPHCYSLEPHITQWIKQQAADVALLHVPVIFGKTALLHAKTFYALKTMGILEEHHQAIFDGIHKNMERLEHEDVIRDFLEKRGVDGNKFIAALHSAKVDEMAKKAYELSKKHNVTSVPLLVINEQATSPSRAGSIEAALAELDQLVEEERQRKAQRE